MQLQLPLYGKIYGTMIVARFARTLGTLLVSGVGSVSYTHLDVYKRQGIGRAVKFSYSYTIPESAPSVLENAALVTGSSGSAEVSAEAIHRVEVMARFSEGEYL